MSKRTITIVNTTNRSISIVKENFKILFEKYGNEVSIVTTNDNISITNNRIITNAKKDNIDFVHIFHDDIIVKPNFDITLYENFMEEYKLGFYTNPRLSPLNYIYDLVAPRLIINAQKYTKANINIYAFDSKEYIIVDTRNNNELFKEDLTRLYNIEYIYRCQKANILPFLNFYFDNGEINEDMIRDNINFPKKGTNQYAYMKEEEVLAKKYDVQWVPHSNADDAINYFRNIKGV
jgi:hypothetical protein